MDDFLTKLPQMYKAAAAFCALLVPFLTSISTALVDGVVTGPEWLQIGTALTAVIGGTKLVYEVRNRKV